MPDPGKSASRRQALGMLAATPVLALAAGRFALPGEAIAAASAATARDAIGVCAHLQDTGSAYHDWNRVEACMRYIGLRHIRTAAPQQGTLGYAIMARAAAAGFMLTFTMRHNRAYANEIADLEAFARANPGSIAGIEGPNEIDHAPVTFDGHKDAKTDAAINPVAALCYQASLYQSVKASPLLRSIPVIAFSDFVQGQQCADASNMHIYPRNGSTLGTRLAALHKRLDPLGRPIFITETGFHTLPGAKPFPGTDEATQAKLIQDAVLSAPKSGVTRTFLYELLDSYPPNASMETHFGLFRHDYSPKPAAKLLHALFASG